MDSRARLASALLLAILWTLNSPQPLLASDPPFGPEPRTANEWAQGVKRSVKNHEVIGYEIVVADVDVRNVRNVPGPFGYYEAITEIEIVPSEVLYGSLPDVAYVWLQQGIWRRKKGGFAHNLVRDWQALLHPGDRIVAVLRRRPASNTDPAWLEFPDHLGLARLIHVSADMEAQIVTKGTFPDGFWDQIVDQDPRNVQMSEIERTIRTIGDASESLAIIRSDMQSLANAPPRVNRVPVDSAHLWLSHGRKTRDSTYQYEIDSTGAMTAALEMQNTDAPSGKQGQVFTRDLYRIIAMLLDADFFSLPKRYEYEPRRLSSYNVHGDNPHVSLIVQDGPPLWFEGYAIRLKFGDMDHEVWFAGADNRVPNGLLKAARAIIELSKSFGFQEEW